MLFLFAAVLLPVARAEVAEAFDTLAGTVARGWTGIGTNVNGHDFGYRTSNLTAITPGGEMGGTFARCSDISYFGDTTLGPALDLTQTLHADGELALFNQSFDGEMRVGFFQAASGGATALTHFIGLNVSEPNNGSAGFRVSPVIALADGTVIIGTFLDTLSTSGTFTFRMDYDPAIGSGQLTIEVFNAAGASRGIRTLNLNSGQRATGAAFDAFGAHIGGRGTGNASLKMDAYLDALTYTSLDDPAPEPDTTPPVADAVTPAPGGTVAELTGITVTFSEAVTGVDAADLLINGAAATGVTELSPWIHAFAFPQPAAGVVSVVWAGGHGIVDHAEPPLAFAGGNWTYTVQTTPTSGGVVINEIHANPNVKTERVEFVELANTSNAAVDIGGWSFSDGMQFVFPGGARIPGNGTVVVAAEPAAVVSRFFGTTDLLVPSGALWSYLDDGSEQGTAWRAPAFDDSTWETGPAPLGYGEDGGDIRTVLRFGPNASNKHITSWFRRPFILTERAGIGGCTLRCRRDDGIVVYLNGTEIFRDNLPTGPLTADTPAESSIGTGIGGETDWFTAAVPPSLLVPGKNWLAVEVHQVSGSSSDVSFDMEFTAERSAPRYAEGVFGPFNGKLSGEGERITLRNAAGQVMESVNYGVGYPWPTVGDDPGNSIQRLHPMADGDLGGHWRGELPTPLAANALVLTAPSSTPPALRQVNHTPENPGSGNPVTISARVTAPAGIASATLQYQLVDPGAYTRFSDQDFLMDWTDVPMNDAGTGGDTIAGDETFSATLPGSMQVHRRLVRYRILALDMAGRRTLAPREDDPQPNFAYYCYNSVPAWTGAVQSGQSTITYGTTVMNSLPVYQLLADPSDVYNSQWNPVTEEADGDRITWYGTLVVGGKVYDHITYRSRADRWWRHGKNHWRFNLSRGHFMEWADNYGDERGTKVAEFGFSSGIDRGTWRGQHGMFESVSFALFNKAGVEAPRTNYLQFRVVDGAAESGPTQYDGDFWGLYMGMEQPEKRFLDAHDLPDGNLYKIHDTLGGTDFSNQQNQGPTQPDDWSDLAALKAVVPYDGASTQPAYAWWTANTNIATYVCFRAIVEAVHHYDNYEKNYHYFNNPETGTWWMLPWDVDMTWDIDQYTGDPPNGSDPWMKNGILNHAPVSLMYQNRVREIRDLLWNPEQAGWLIDEHAKFVQPLAEADRRLWDYHPAMSYNGISQQGMFYDNFTPRSFSGAVAKMKSWVATRTAFLDGLAADNAIPNTPTITAGTATFPVNDLTFTASAFSDPQGAGSFGAMQWRVAEVTDPTAPAYDPAAPTDYEIKPLWESGVLTGFSSVVTIPPVCKTGHAYRTRVRMMDNTGRWSHWSAPVQFTATAPDVSVITAALVISEVNYNPAPATPVETAVGFSNGDFEWVEVKNTSARAVDMTDLRFTKGVDFDFPAGWTIPAGGFALVVRDLAGFQTRYGHALDGIIAGITEDNFKNSGEQVKLSFGAGTAIVDFTYMDGAPWPAEADGTGKSLTLRKPDTHPDPTLPANWKASYAIGGTPGADDALTFDAWAADFPGIGGPTGDDDSDGLENLLEFALLGDPTQNSAAQMPVGGVRSFTIDGTPGDYLTLTFTRRAAAGDLQFHVEFASSLPDSWNENGVLVSSTPGAEGIVTETWRAPTTIAAESSRFARLLVLQTAP